MSDREMLELAAKAAGLRITWGEKYRLGADEIDCTDLPYVVSDSPDEAPYYWNPLADDGDALRLAVKLMMNVEPWGAGASAVVIVNNRALVAEPHYGDDPERATRRAIVRAAAEIGKTL